MAQGRNLSSSRIWAVLWYDEPAGLRSPRLVRLDGQQVPEYMAFLGRVVVREAGGVEDGLALSRRKSAQVIEGPAHYLLAAGGHLVEGLRRRPHLLPSFGWKPFKGLIARQHALPHL